ncbi:Zinc finger protein CONSTANS 16 [Spatholobus suberectus]|nr:Zinc finger protein CONSTANS 16 [Spatholobus suberectus]
MRGDMKDAGALGAKTARACDSCIRRRARWFCAADDAFLCHGCDTLVHSANQLASRHERVRLQTTSSKVNTTAYAWHSGFTRKARTPRHNNNNNNNKHFALQQRLKDEVLFNNTSVLPLVPELGWEEQEQVAVDNDETEERMLCRVPVFDPFDVRTDDLDSFSDMDFAEFAADVESLLDKEEDKTSAGVGRGGEVGVQGAMVKVKDEDEVDGDVACYLESVFDMTNEDAFRWNNIESVLSGARQESKRSVVTCDGGVSEEGGTKRDIFLRLNYDEVITAWASQGSSPWTTANPPKFNSDYDFCLGLRGADGEIRSLRGHLDGGREARVSRYREKRRTRLFAKKIRYEVRKLNAEKRPRMKGRFVKRTCFVGANAFPAYH